MTRQVQAESAAEQPTPLRKRARPRQQVRLDAMPVGTCHEHKDVDTDRMQESRMNQYYEGRLDKSSGGQRGQLCGSGSRRVTVLS